MAEVAGSDDFFWAELPAIGDDGLHTPVDARQEQVDTFADVDEMLARVHQQPAPDTSPVLEECNWITPTEEEVRAHIQAFFEQENRVFHLSASNVKCFRELYEKEEGMAIREDGYPTVVDHATTNSESARCIFYSMVDNLSEYEKVFNELCLMCGNAAFESIILPTRKYVYDELEKTAGPLMTPDVIAMINRETNARFAKHLQADISFNSVVWDIVKIQRVARVDTIYGVLLARQFRAVALEAGADAYDNEMMCV
jgi:hypothetical protein